MFVTFTVTVREENFLRERDYGVLLKHEWNTDME